MWNQENLTGSPLHLLAVLAASIAGWVRAMRGREKALASYAAAALLGYALLAWIGHATIIYSIRYQLAYLALGAPLVGLALARSDRRWIAHGAAGVLLIYALPYLLISNMRPVIGMPPWPTRVGSIFTAAPAEVLFALNPGNRDEYERVTELIGQAECGEVGLWLHSEDLEYPIWWLFEAPQSGVQLRFVRTEPPLEKYLDAGYNPCAIICTQCRGAQSVDGLPLRADYGQIQLFMHE